MADRLFYIGRGSTFHSYREGETVVKVSRGFSNLTDAYDKLDQYTREYDILKRFLGGYVHNSKFTIEEDPDWRVKVKQSSVTGTPLREVLGRGNPAVQDFFRKSLKMYEETGLVPDLFPDIMPDPTLGMYFTGKYHYRSGPNVLLVDQNPVLIDTTLNKLIRGRLIGHVVRPLVARRIQSLIV